jgi:WD40 repeat protein
VKLVASAKAENAALFAVAFHPNGESVAVTGADGQLRLYETKSGKLVKTSPVAPKLEKPTASTTIAAARPQEPVTPEKLPTGTTLVSLEPLSKHIVLQWQHGQCRCHPAIAV